MSLLTEKQSRSASGNWLFIDLTPAKIERHSGRLNAKLCPNGPRVPEATTGSRWHRRVSSESRIGLSYLSTSTATG